MTRDLHRFEIQARVTVLCSRSLYHYYCRRYSPGEETSPLELVQSLLSGRLAPGAHVIITSRPHTLTYLQVILCIMTRGNYDDIIEEGNN